MNHASLFSGIGGFEKAAKWMGWNNVFHCERDKFCQRVLKYHYPNAITHEDIKETDFKQYRGTVDILSGGFPCQPFSVAGKRKGTGDDRYLWPEMLRVIREIQPTWVVGENVRGLVSWDGGLVFEQVSNDLETEGFEVFPVILPAASVNAPHRRERIFFIAYSASNGKRRDNELKNGSENRNDAFGRSESSFGSGDASDSNGNERLEGRMYENRSETTKRQFSGAHSRNIGRNWENFPTQWPIHSRDDGLSSRLDGITVSKWRKETIKASGNAVVPQVVLQIFKAIEHYERFKTLGSL